MTAPASPHPAPRRELATRKTRWAHAVAENLGRAGIRPNGVSIAGAVFASAAGAAFVAAPDQTKGFQALCFAGAAVAIQLRLLCNLLDGMLAVEGGFKSKAGELFNEVPDRLADVIILVGAGYSIRSVDFGATLGWLAASLALFTAYLRLLAGSLGLVQHFIGPMAKQHRMFTLTVSALVAAVEALAGRPPDAIWIGLVLIVAGSAVTAVRRLSRTARELDRR